MWKGTPRRFRYSGSTCAGKPGCFWSRLTATRSKGTGARSRSADQDVQQRVAVLAARQADHDLVAGLDHVEVADGLAHLAVQPLAQLVGLEGGLARVGARRGGCA